MAETDSHEYLEKVRRFLRLDKLPPLARKIVVFTVGWPLLIAGVIMVVTPGPAFIVVPLGLMILGFELKWAETASNKMIEWLHRVRQKWKNRKRQAHAQ